MAAIISTKQINDCIMVELDNGELLKIPYTVIHLYAFETGRNIDATEYQQLKIEHQRYLCKKKALDYLAIRTRSSMEMERYLVKKGFDYPIIKEITSGLMQAGYIDDVQFAAEYIKNRLSKKLIGKNLLAKELQKRGISRSIVKQTLKNSNAESIDVMDIYFMAQKKYHTLKHKQNAINKLAFFLLSRGFDHDTVNNIIRRIQDEEKIE